MEQRRRLSDAESGVEVKYGRAMWNQPVVMDRYRSLSGRWGDPHGLHRYEGSCRPAVRVALPVVFDTDRRFAP